MNGSDRGEGTVILAGQKASARHADQQTANGNKQGSEPKSAVSLPLKQPPANSETAVANQQAQTEQPSQYDLRDLTAQEDMAFWAMWMFVAALATFAITSLGTLFIWRQVKFTRQAVEDTGRATVAMEAQNELAKDTAQRQMRAYINVDACEIHLIDDGFILSATLKNCGQTPAYRVRIMGESFAAEYPLRTPNRAFEEVGERHDAPLGPGQVHSAPYAIRSPDPQEAMKQVLAGQVGLYIQGLCRYEDAFGNARETRFRYVFGGRPARSGGLVMHAAEMGNSAT